MQKLKKLKYFPINIFLKVKKFFNKFFKVKTYHLEMLFVAVILSAVVIASGSGFIEWIGAIAVLLSFGYMTLNNRLHESQEQEDQGKLYYYYMSKEIFWLMYFVILGAYSGIVGIFIFICYHPWRNYYRKYSKLS
jgi:uncharacterized membrane protein YfcA